MDDRLRREVQCRATKSNTSANCEEGASANTNMSMHINTTMSATKARKEAQTHIYKKRGREEDVLRGGVVRG